MASANVLVVEDDDQIRQLLVEYLQSHSMVQVDSARDGVEALHQIATAPPRVIVLDVMMPKMSGIDLLESLKALTSDPSVKSLSDPPVVLVITAAPENVLDRETIERRFPDLVHGLFRKPLDVPALCAAVERWLRL
jgi:two-component system sensor histidine kinase ChiS